MVIQTDNHFYFGSEIPVDKGNTKSLRILRVATNLSTNGNPTIHFNSKQANKGIAQTSDACMYKYAAQRVVGRAAAPVCMGHADSGAPMINYGSGQNN